MKDGTREVQETEGGGHDPRRGFCACPGCPLLGSFGRGGDWYCFCHYDTDYGARDFVTAVIRRHFAVYRASVDGRRGFASDAWPQAYREVQQRLIDFGYSDLLPDARDASPYRPGRPIVQQWLARVERFLSDAVRAALRERAVEAAHEGGEKKRVLPSSRDCVERMKASISNRAPSAKWAFDMLDGIAANPAHARPPEAVRVALDAIRSPAGRAHIANATDAERGRWHAALEAIGGDASDCVPSREPGADDEPIIEQEASHDPV